MPYSPKVEHEDDDENEPPNRERQTPNANP